MNKMRPFKNLGRVFSYPLGNLFLMLGNRALRRNHIDQAERYLLKAASYHRDLHTYLLFRLLASQQGKKAKKIYKPFRRKPVKRSHQGAAEFSYSDELPRFMALLFSRRIEDRINDIDPFSARACLTSNFLPPFFLNHEDRGPGDFATRWEYQRFRILPPISKEEVKSVDLDKLLKALIRKPD